MRGLWFTHTHIYGEGDASLVAQMVKHLVAMWKTRVWSLGQEDPLEKEMGTHSSTLAWRIPWMEEPGTLQSMGSQRVRYNWVTSFSLSHTHTHTHTHCWCCCSVSQSCPILCDPMDCSTPGLPVPYHLLEFAQVHVHCIGDAVQQSHPLTPSSPSVLNLSQHQGLFQWVICSHQMTKILELELQDQSFQWIFRVDLH